jgi:outer membrane protein
VKLISKKLAISSAIASALCVGTTVTAHADTIGGDVKVSYWQGAYSGDVFSRADQQTIDLEQDLNYDDGGFLEISASLEHPIPIIPNIRISHIDLDESADGAISGTFEGVNFTGDVESNLDLTNTSVTLYYEVLDNFVSLDIGLETKIFDGRLYIKDKTTGDVSDTKIDDPIPMLYAGVSADLPLTGLSVGADVSAISYSGDKFLDAKARVRYDLGLVFLEGGYRQMSVQVDDVSGIDVDASISGVYLSTGLDF